ncbi:hypothetical protein NDN08_001507 [Rhodosorus marinus]|uniref:Uncharacterized protein n=1 Tax=Rhodosorus marinus TaxID=101924 RepID=A0AAV8UR23_9RHOD|nr:hypothetical protein NDN08_001507 [Rhodosorus marinus]
MSENSARSKETGHVITRKRVSGSLPRYGFREGQQQKPVKLKSMTDALTSNSREINQDDAWTVLTDTLSKFDSGNHNRDTIEPSVLDSVEDTRHTLTASNDLVLSGSAKIPEDFVIKSSAKFVSRTSFDWCKCIGAESMTLAMEDFLTKTDPGSDDPARCFAAGLLYYQHPKDSDLPLSITKSWRNIVGSVYTTTATQANASEKFEVVSDRVSKWEAALRSLYFRWRYEFVDRFYVMIGNQAVLFSRRANGDLRATMTRSNPGQRAALDEFGIMYSAPLISKPDIDKVNEVDRSLLLFSSTGDIHGLYNYLLSAGPKFSSVSDVPVLLAEHAFEGATLARLSISLLQEIQDSQNSFHHVIEIEGAILPHNLQRIVTALQLRNKQFEGVFVNDDRLMEVNAFAESSIHGATKKETIDRPFEFAAKGIHSIEEEAAYAKPGAPPGKISTLGRRFLSKIAGDKDVLTFFASIQSSK